MLNSVSLVGRIIKTTYYINDLAYIDIEVKKPISFEYGKDEFEIFHIQLWKGLEEMLCNQNFLNSLIAIRGRLVNNQDECFVYAEIVELLDKHFHK